MNMNIYIIKYKDSKELTRNIVLPILFGRHKGTAISTNMITKDKAILAGKNKKMIIELIMLLSLNLSIWRQNSRFTS